MIKENIQKWHDLIKGDYSGGFDELLDDDVSFYSPIVFSPQRGKELTTLYLMAAGNTFVGDQSIDGTLEESSFKYTKEVLDGNQAVLEFETQIDGKYVNEVRGCRPPRHRSRGSAGSSLASRCSPSLLSQATPCSALST